MDAVQRRDDGYQVPRLWIRSHRGRSPLTNRKGRDAGVKLQRVSENLMPEIGFLRIRVTLETGHTAGVEPNRSTRSLLYDSLIRSRSVTIVS
jgi:hypothetical protein